MSKYQTGNKNGMWKGGKTMASNGYVLVRVGKDHPLSDVRGYAYEHRIVACEKLGRLLSSDEVIHHKDGNKTNNHPDNLEILSNKAEHGFRHRKIKQRRMPGEPNPIIFCQCGCGISFPKFDKYGRPRKFVTGHNMYGVNDER